MNIQNNLHNIQHRIAEMVNQSHRLADSVTLLAVSKTKPVTDIEQAIKAGQCCFGENYVQEGVDKVQYFSRHAPSTPLTWHFIGPLQSNKTRLVAEHFDWVQTIDRLKIAERLHQQRPENLAPLNILIQVNISNEETKSGISPDEVLSFAKQLTPFFRLKLRGIMAIPAPTSVTEEQLIIGEKMSAIFSSLQHHFSGIDTLSLGMSDDMESAIKCGSTMVRIGSAIFGARHYA